MDCLGPDGMATLADRSVDVTITDPPYSAKLYEKTRTNRGSGRRPNGRPTSRGEGTQASSPFVLASGRIGAIDDILEPLVEQIKRLTKRWAIVFHDAEIWDRYRQAFGDWYVRAGIWVKTDPMPQVTGDRPGQGFEAITIAHRPGRKRWNGGGRPATWICGTSKGAERPNHPCPKPVPLMEQLIADFTEPDELVLDPFAGSGTTGYAAKRLGRRFVGFERDPEFFAEASARLARSAPLPAGYQADPRQGVLL